MRKFVLQLAAAALLCACGQSGNDDGSANAPANAAAAKPKAKPYCFFKGQETKDWKATAGKDGNVVVTGKVYREDARYKAVLLPASVGGAAAEVSPTIVQNDTGFAAPENWWDVSQTIADSQAVTSVSVTCGDKTLASLAVPRKK